MDTKSDLLLKNHPEIFGENFYFECGDGWFNIIDQLCYSLKRNKCEVRAAQVKEKFGGLRFYVDGGSEESHAIISFAERLSYVTCESCGSPGKVGGKGWITTLCSTCRKELPDGQEKAFDHIKALERNWDSYGSEAPTQKTIQKAKELCLLLGVDCVIQPMTGGTIEIFVDGVEYEVGENSEK